MHYTSAKIQNDMISLIGKVIQQNIVHEIKKAGSIIADETMDISRLEQMSLCVRYVTNNFVINERFVGFRSTATTDISSRACRQVSSYSTSTYNEDLC